MIDEKTADNGKKQFNDFFRLASTREEALKAAHNCSNAFYFVAALQGAIALFMAPAMLVDAAFYAGLSYALRRWQSRVAASLLVALAVADMVMTFRNKFGGGEGDGGGRNVFLALMIVWIAVKAADAAFKLHGKFMAEATTETLPPAQTESESDAFLL